MSSDTPETDDLGYIPTDLAAAWPIVEHARRLERQRNIAVAALKELAAQYGHKSAPGCGCDDCRHIRPIEYAIRDATVPHNAQMVATPPEPQ